jgi:putative oxidoreductase
MKQKILFGISLVFGLFFINAGLNKFLHYMPMPENVPENLIKVMTSLMETGWVMPLLAVAEILGGILYISSKTRALGAVVIFPVLTGILLTHIVNDPTGLPMAAVLYLVNLWVIYENREKYLPMIQ